MKIAIIGSRTFTDYKLLDQVLNDFMDKNNILITHVISGGANGADKLGERFADSIGAEKIIFYPDWNKHKKAAGFIRNKDIVDNSEMVFAFWDGKSRGTKHSIDYARSQKIEVYIQNF